ncbi:MAG TPA: LUD domain-containing protein, partial [Acidobacteriaceae bacterium]
MSPRERSPLDPRTAPPFPIAARALLRDAQLRSNVRHATDIIEARRARVVGELRDWEPLRESGRAVREHTFAHLAGYLEQFEDNCTRAGGVVHWARDAAEAQAIVTRLVQQSGSAEVIKIKSMTTEEIGLNDALARAGIRAYETDLAELILQLGHDQPSHIVVPALHKNRAQIRALFRQQMNLPDLGDSP